MLLFSLKLRISRNVRNLVLLTIAVFSVLEALAYGFFRLAGDRFHFPNPEKYMASPAEIERAAKSFDRDLGWVVGYDTPFGERPRQIEYGRALVAAFGDSFTHGDEAKHAETWPEQLAALLAADVYNYGSSAYGMDQSLLRMERDYYRQPTAFTILAFITYDIERNVSVYWKFLAPESGLALTKPRFVLAEDGLALLPNPIASAPDAAVLLRDAEFVRRLGEHDWWYNRHRLPDLRFPYAAMLVNKNFIRAVVAGREPPDLWNVPEPRAVTERILVRFHESSRARGARPLLVHLPVSWEIAEYVKSGTLPAAVEQFATICAAHEIDCYTPIRKTKGMSQSEVSSLFTQGAAGGHYNARGNAFIARQLARIIEEQHGYPVTRP